MSPATPNTKVTSSTTRNKLFAPPAVFPWPEGLCNVPFPFFKKNFRMLVLCLTFPKAFMMTGNVVGRRLTMNWSYGSVGSARAAAKKGALECQTMECSLFGQKTASVCPVYGENGCRIAAVLLSAAVFVCGTEIRKRSCPGSFGRERFCGQKRRESQRRALVSQPLMPSEAIPRIRCFWRKRNRISSGRQVTTTPAIVRFSRLK